MKSKYWLAINYNYDHDANNDFLEEKGIKDYNQDVYEFYFENKDNDNDNHYILVSQEEYEQFLTTKDLAQFMQERFETIPYKIYDNVRGLEIKEIEQELPLTKKEFATLFYHIEVRLEQLENDNGCSNNEFEEELENLRKLYNKLLEV